MDAADKFQISVLANALRAMSCEGVSSVVCEYFYDSVKETALQLHETFLAKVYDPFYPVYASTPGAISLETLYSQLLQVQLELYQAQLVLLDSCCELVASPVSDVQVFSRS